MLKKKKSNLFIRLCVLLLVFVGTVYVFSNSKICSSDQEEYPWETGKRMKQDEIGGVAQIILEQQSIKKINVPEKKNLIRIIKNVAKEFTSDLIDKKFHMKGKTIRVPKDYNTIQKGIDASESGDIVLVSPGTYYELLVMKNGVKLMSDPIDGGDELISVEGAVLKLPYRTLRTIIDGTGAKPTKHGMLDFNAGIGRKTIVDGFTIQNLPHQNHHIPGHAHGINIRGASPCIVNCLIQKNGSTGIGNHVVFNDQENRINERDFRKNNIKFKASAIIYNNIIHSNLGLGIGSNHYSEPFITGNEVFNNNDSDLGEDPSPGIGNKHGSGAIIIGNIIHDNPGGGILCKVGAPQGTFPIGGQVHTIIKSNLVYNNSSIRPEISCKGVGSKITPVKIIGNYIYNPGLIGIALNKDAIGIIEANMVFNSHKPGISISGGIALKLNSNKVTGTKTAPGFSINNNAEVYEMLENAADNNKGPRFMLKNGIIKLPKTYQDNR